MPTPATDEQIAQFRKDAKFLHNLYSNKEMDKKLGTKRNLSGYINPTEKNEKRPSVEIIERFYTIYGKDLQYFSRQIPEEFSVVQENPESYGLDLLTKLKYIMDELSAIKQMLANQPGEQALSELQLRVRKIEDQLSAKDNSPEK